MEGEAQDGSALNAPLLQQSAEEYGQEQQLPSPGQQDLDETGSVASSDDEESASEGGRGGVVDTSSIDFFETRSRFQSATSLASVSTSALPARASSGGGNISASQTIEPEAIVSEGRHAPIMHSNSNLVSLPGAGSHAGSSSASDMGDDEAQQQQDIESIQHAMSSLLTSSQADLERMSSPRMQQEAQPSEAAGSPSAAEQQVPDIPGIQLHHISQRSSGDGASSSIEALPAAHEDDTADTWTRHGKHFFILTSSGKPVYSYHGREDLLASLMALITALVSVVQDQGDHLQHIVSGGSLVVFAARGPLLLVGVSNLGEPIRVLQRQLDLMHKQVLLVVTTGLERILTRNPAYDARPLLEGVGGVLDALATSLRTCPAHLLPGLQPVALPAAERTMAAQLLGEAVKASGALYGVLLACGASGAADAAGGAPSSSSAGQVVALERAPGSKSAPAPPPLDPCDLLLLSNFIASTPGIRQGAGEAFCPVCLPAYNPGAFMHAYIAYLEPQSGLALVLLAAASDSFHALSAARCALEPQLTALGLVRRLAGALTGRSGGRPTVEALPRPLGGRFGSTPLWHFMARLPTRRQVVCSALGVPPHTCGASRQQLVLAHARLHSLVMDFPEGSRPNKLVWHVDDRSASLALVDAEVELYAVMDPLTDRATALRVGEGLRAHLTDRAVQADLLLPHYP